MIPTGFTYLQTAYLQIPTNRFTDEPWCALVCRAGLGGCDVTVEDDLLGYPVTSAILGYRAFYPFGA
jgi:hypothetical protein